MPQEDTDTDQIDEGGPFLDDDLDEEDWEEIDRRMAEHDANPASAISWEEIRARLYERFG